MTGPLHLFEAVGVELEYMLTDADTLDVRPEVDHLLRDAAGRQVSDIEDRPLTWSNELVRHVIEVKVSEPAPSLAGLLPAFQASIARMNALAERRQARLLPTAMHPWMEPGRETVLWPHDYAEVYQRYDRIFDCRRHGWANLQSVHVNLPFHGDAEFNHLHAAIRLVLPLIPALAAASPIMDGRRTGVLDNRLDVYCNNSRKIAEIAGAVIPEPVFSEQAYRDTIFAPMYRAIAPFDPEGVLQDEFLNSRGAIPRFDRGAIEIRLIDVQECPAADLAIVGAVVHAVRHMAEETWSDLDAQRTWSAERLRAILQDTLRDADHAVIVDADFLRAWGMKSDAACPALAVWRHILDGMSLPDPALDAALSILLDQGVLARRMLSHLPDDPTRDHLRALYRRLADGLAGGRMLPAATRG